jgi:hypothetical protein
MARVNVGINPIYLSDQHLLAEGVEILMIIGGLEKNGYVIKGKSPSNFTLGTGHINFFKDKIIYLSRRLNEVKKEMKRRGFSSENYNIDFNKIPVKFLNDWSPSEKDFLEVKNRIVDRIENPLKAKKSFHKYNKSELYNVNYLKNAKSYAI